MPSCNCHRHREEEGGGVGVEAATFHGVIYQRRNNISGFISLQFAPYVAPFGDASRQLSQNVQEFMFKHRPKDVQDCCNGLVLLARQLPSSPTKYYVTNLTTSECIQVPVNLLHYDFKYASLAFDPTVSLHYKIVRFNSISHPVRVDVFSSETGDWAWHNVVFEPMLDIVNWTQPSVYLNGVLYRLSVANYLVSINLGLKEYQKNNLNLKARAIELPQKDEFNKCGSIGTSRGRLLYFNNDQHRMLIWTLDDRSCWVLKHSTKFCASIFSPALQIMTAFGDFKWLKFHAFHPNKDEIFVGTTAVMLIYDLNTKKFSVFKPMADNETILSGEYHVFPFWVFGVILNTVNKSH